MVITALISSLFGLVSAVCWGVGDFLAAKATKRSTAETSAIWVSIISTLSFALVYLFTSGNYEWSRNGVIYAIFAGLCLEFGLYVFYRALDAGPVSIVSPISSTYPLISTLVLILFFRAKLSGFAVISILIIVTGLMLASGLLDTKRSERKLSAGLIYASITVVLWGVAYALIGQAVHEIGWQKTSLIDTTAGLLSLFTLFAVTQRVALKDSLHLKQAKNPFIIGTALAQILGGIVFTIGVSRTDSPAVIIAISATYPALTVFLALRHLNEKKHIGTLVGALLAIIGVIILSITAL